MKVRCVFESWRSSRLGKRLTRALLALDAFVDSSFYESQQDAKAYYARFSAVMDRFHVSGWRRAVVEITCEGLTLGLGGGLVALFLALPAFQYTTDDWLKKQDLAVTFLDHYGQEVGRRGIKHDDAASFDQLPEYLIQAVLATEDRRFFDHFGIDFIGTFRALTVNARASTVVQGGSSITQQLAKNLFLSNERTLQRKINEAYLALWLEGHLSKRKILELYLDRVYMGGGTFGVQAASEFYFGKSVRDLTLPEAAMLAGLFKAPTKYAPHINLPAARARANDVLNNMVDAGYMTEGQIYAAQRNPATPVDRQRDSSPDWYLDWAYDEVKKLADAGKLGNDRVLTVRTELDSNLQKFADTTIEDQLRQNGRAYHVKQSAMVILDPATGAVRTVVGGRDYGASQFNRAVDALRQPGSSFKPIVYLTALLTGKFKPSTIVVDAPFCIGNYCPHNYGDKYYGSLPLIQALTHSLNTVAVRLSVAIGNGSPKLGRAKIIQTARLMGISSPLPDTVSLPIGADEVSVMDMAGAYAIFANGGKRVVPHAAAEIRNSRGEVIYRHDRNGPAPKQVFNASAILDMVTMMRSVVENGTGRRAQLDNIEVAGKTGTTNGYKDAWFNGYTGNYVGTVWFGNDDDTPMNNMTGGTLPAATWHEVMTYAHQGIELKPLFGHPTPAAPAVASAPAAGVAELGSPQHPASLNKRSIDVLGTIETVIRHAQQGRGEAEAAPVSFAAEAVPSASGFRPVNGRNLH